MEKKMRQAENKVFIEGILSENNLEVKEYDKKMPDGTTRKMKGIMGTLTVKVPFEDKEIVVKPKYFINQYKNDGNSNPVFEKMTKTMESLVSIAASNEEEASRVKISGANLRENMFVGRNGEVVSGAPQIVASFCDIVKKEDFKPAASFTLEFVVGQIQDEVDKEGIETGRVKVVAIIPTYGDRVDVLPLYSGNANVKEAISQYWDTNNTVSAKGRLDFTVETITKTIEMAFGDNEERTYTNTKNEVVITGGSEPLDGEREYERTDIEVACENRKAYAEKLKQDWENKQKKGSTSPEAKKKMSDFGF